MTIIRRLALLLLLALLVPAAMLLYGYWETQWNPAVHRADVPLANWPAGVPPLTVLLVSDTHVAGPDMPPERLARLVDRLSALQPDLVLLAGDYISNKQYATRHYSIAEATAPLARFRARLGVVAVLGNHDHWAGTAAFSLALRQAGITLLRNEAIRRGPLVIGGLDDSFSGHADLVVTENAMRTLGPGPRILLTHTPDAMLQMRFPVDAVLAGHSHCGQIVLPLLGMPAHDARDFQWLPCGRLDVNGYRLFVGAGLGTSIVPIRLGAPPDAWLIRFGSRAGLAARRPTS